MRFKMSISGFLPPLFICLCVWFLVSGAAQPSKAQDATDTPAPQLSPTWGPIITNTPSRLTATPAVTLTPAGCPDEDIADADLLDPSWVAQCSRCVAARRATPMATIQQFTLVTVPPIGTHVDLTALPTLPPMFSLYTNTPLPTDTPMPTNTPAPSATPAFYEKYWDLRVENVILSPYGYSGNLGSATGVCPVEDAAYPSGSWIFGQGWVADAHAWQPGHCGGFFISAQLPMWESFRQSGAVAFTIYLNNADAIWHMLVAQPSNENFPAPFVTSGGARGTYAQSWSADDIEDLRGLVIEYLGNTAIEISGIAFAYEGAPFVEASSPPPSPTPTLSPTDIPVVVYDCEVPEYANHDPVADVSIDTEILQTDCYTVIPYISVTITDPDINYDGLEVCVNWIVPPSVTWFGITLSVDFLAVIPAAYLLRRAFQF